MIAVRLFWTGCRTLEARDDYHNQATPDIIL
ncbi:hypothetical protein AF42_04763 [Citrobacter freundii MGH 56]|jgi:hypothetical protein|nr:hypothetical protein AF42_04763 [Citrobacter freundii MGH 56]